jgi:hypothetical protein
MRARARTDYCEVVWQGLMMEHCRCLAPPYSVCTALLCLRACDVLGYFPEH